MEDFRPFPKLARLARKCIITEKIDGTNAQVVVSDDGKDIRAGSRTRWITPTADNFGFAAWVEENREDLLKLGPGQHFGEWWGRGIQRNYGVDRRYFSLFNAERWQSDRPACCRCVPVLYRGEFSTEAVDEVLKALADMGSQAAPGFMKPEGVVVYHRASNSMFKKTIEKDAEPKSLAA